MLGSLGSLKQPFEMEKNQDDARHAVNAGPTTVLENYGPVPAGTVYGSAIWQQVNNDDFGTSPSVGYSITLTFTCTSDI
jgi:hypothetical protein